MPELVEVELVRHALRLQRVIELRGVLGHHVEVVVAVREQRGGLEVADVLHVVAVLPERAPVPRRAVLIGGHLVDRRPALRALAELVRARVDVLGEHVQVLALEAAGSAHHAVGAVVVVPVGDGGDRDDPSRPSTPVEAAAIGSVPLYEVPIMPTLPVVQSAATSTSPVRVV